MGGFVTLVGNPRAGSRTRSAAIEAARHVAGLSGLDASGEIIDLAAFGPHLLSPVPSAVVEAALDLAAGASVLLVASPTYKASYPGLLKAFLDRLPPNALAGTVALPLMVMGDPRHALAVEVHLRPVLVELGAAVPTPGLALQESELPSGLPDEPPTGALTRWAALVAPQVTTALGRAVPA